MQDKKNDKKKEPQSRMNLNDAYCSIGWICRTVVEQVAGKTINRELDEKLGAALAAAFPAKDVIQDDFSRSAAFHMLSGAWHVLKRSHTWDQ